MDIPLDSMQLSSTSFGRKPPLTGILSAYNRHVNAWKLCLLQKADYCLKKENMFVNVSASSSKKKKKNQMHHEE